MRVLVLCLLSMANISFANSFGFNSVGGIYASQMSTAVARVNDETSPYTNPAGLGAIYVNSISSGASSYSALKAQKDDENQITTSSSTSHVSYVESFDKFNIGFMVYTMMNSSDQKIESKRYSNSENYPSYYYYSSSNEQSSLMYILAFAPKKKNWGVSLNLYDLKFSYKTSTGRHSYFKTDYSKRSWNTSFFHTQFKMKLLSLTLGQQFASGNFRFGYRVESPAYILSNDSHQTVDMMYITPYLQNDAYVLANNVDTDLDIETNQFINERVTFGAAYIKNKFQYEINVQVEAASQDQVLRPDQDFKSYTWFSQTDTYSTQTPESEDSSGEYSKAKIIPSFGVQFSATNQETYGAGVSYQKTNSKDSSGVNTVAISTGYAKRFKNFLGTYSLIYQKDFDTGHNFIYDYEKQNDVKTDLTKENLSLVFGGSYTF